MTRALLRGVSPALISAVMASALVASPMVVGHRGTGASKGTNPYPENTIPSIEAAFAEGADLVEIDVQLDRDGVPILWHDKTVRVDGSRRKTHEVALADFPVQEGGDGLTAPVPSFREALQAALALGPHARVLDIELKVTGDSQRAPLVAAVCQILREERAARRVMFSSFDLEALELVEGELPGIETGLLGVFSNSTLKKAKKALARGVAIEWIIPGSWFNAVADPIDDATGVNLINASGFVQKAHAAGLLVGVWTLNDADDIQRYAERGYDMIITDEPDVARNLLPPAYGLAE